MFTKHESSRPNTHLTGCIVFIEDSFNRPYSLDARTYVVSSNNKAFQPGMGGYSIWCPSGSLHGSRTCRQERLESGLLLSEGGVIFGKLYGFHTHELLLRH